MKILIVGSGGREHALAWKISCSARLEKLYCAPGNGGTAALAENIAIADSDIAKLADFAQERKVDLTVVGPELPLTLGIVDEFERRGLKIFGPSRSAAELEGSKVFAKQFMERHGIPTARFKVARKVEEAQKILKSREFSYPLAVKADGLAAGKGAIICADKEKALDTVRFLMVQNGLGEAGRSVVIEEFLRGKEVSFIVISDGSRVQPLVTTMDHKAVYDGDQGPNTGGMGAISPSPFIDAKLFEEVMKKIIYPTVNGMREEKRLFKGVLYAGLMLTGAGPKVLEFNGRFGDPETQAQMVRLESDLAEVILMALRGNILEREIRWNEKPSGCVVLCSGGYPLHYEKGKLIQGLEEVAEMPGITLFHAGTKWENDQYWTNGGRVIGVCASQRNLKETMKKIYQAIPHISFEGMHYRRDIGTRRQEA